MSSDEKEWYTQNKSNVLQMTCAMVASGRAAIFASGANNQEEGAAMVIEAAAAVIKGLDVKCGKIVPKTAKTTPKAKGAPEITIAK